MKILIALEIDVSLGRVVMNELMPIHEAVERLHEIGSRAALHVIVA